MQLDTEDGETFIPPAGVVASPSTEASPSALTDRPQSQDSEDQERGQSTLQAAIQASRDLEE